MLASDTEEERLAKAVLTLVGSLAAVSGLVWGSIYALLGRPVSAAVPTTYSVVFLISFLWFAQTKRVAPFRFIQLLLYLVLPFSLQASLGGFVQGSAVMLWAIFAPVGALILGGRRASVPWLTAYAILGAMSGLAEGQLVRQVPPLPGASQTIFFVMNVLGVSGMIYLVLRYFMGERDLAMARSERLLLNILPKPVADRLRHDPRAIADGFDEVSILFADIAEFTPYSASVPPHELVEFLNKLFSDFDRLAGRYGLEKIKTIGDCYMVAAGLPTPRADHLEALAEMALEMQRSLNGRTFPDDRPLQVRIGIHSGPVVAGVIGVQKFIYDLWGDTVNLASRMESHGLPGTIQVSPAVYEALRSRYRFEERGDVAIKGKGSMRTYLLVGRMEQPPAGDIGIGGSHPDRISASDIVR